MNDAPLPFLQKSFIRRVLGEEALNNIQEFPGGFEGSFTRDQLLKLVNTYLEEEGLTEENRPTRNRASRRRRNQNH